jgi:subtilase family serine protease
VLQVISISYSISEHFLTLYEVVIFDIEATKLLLQGVTILAAAGDAGVTGDGLGHDFCGYNPVFPASSIYVTAVGGTQGTPPLLLDSKF